LYPCSLQRPPPSCPPYLAGTPAPQKSPKRNG
jgi:hypothetical protein